MSKPKHRTSIFIDSKSVPIDKPFEYKPNNLPVIDLTDYRSCNETSIKAMWKHVEEINICYQNAINEVINELKPALLIFGNDGLEILNTEDNNSLIFDCTLLYVKKPFEKKDQKEIKLTKANNTPGISDIPNLSPVEIIWAWNVDPTSYSDTFGEVKDIKKLKPEQLNLHCHPPKLVEEIPNSVDPEKIYCPWTNCIFLDNVITLETMRLCHSLNLIPMIASTKEYTLMFGIKLKDDKGWKEFKKIAMENQ